jgi:hypothetical protein
VRHYQGNNSEEDEEDGPEVGFFVEGKTEQDRYIEMVQANLSAHEINQNTLAIAIDILERSWWWRFRSTKSKMKLLQQTYAELTQLI